MSILQYNPILATDSYKFSHQFAYPDNVTGMYAYIEARSKGDIIVPFGMKMFVMKYLTQKITTEHIDEAEAFCKGHGDPFDRAPWEKIVNTYNGYMPITIKSIPEGTPVESGNAILTIECVDPDLFWLVSYIETSIQRSVWYPTTIASLDYAVKKDIVNLYKLTGADEGLIPFALHDFGARGVTCAEQAEIGGAAHLVNFMGSDTVEGTRAANFYYNHEMSSFSVPATEHSVECSFGESEEDEIEYLRHTIETFAKPGGIVSIVIDGFDVYRAANTLCTTLKDTILNSKAKIVFRPDSGDMMETVPRILEMQANAFGTTLTSKGYKKVNTVGIIQGDGVDRMAIKSLLGKLACMGYSADNVVFGSGGALLQKVNRDTFKFAQKSSAILADGKWVGISKNPVTDPGKKSKSGRVDLFLVDGKYVTMNKDQEGSKYESALVTIYDGNGVCLSNDTLEMIRNRCMI